MAPQFTGVISLGIFKNAVDTLLGGCGDGEELIIVITLHGGLELYRLDGSYTSECTLAPEKFSVYEFEGDSDDMILVNVDRFCVQRAPGAVEVFGAKNVTILCSEEKLHFLAKINEFNLQQLQTCLLMERQESASRPVMVVLDDSEVVASCSLNDSTLFKEHLKNMDPKGADPNIILRISNHGLLLTTSNHSRACRFADENTAPEMGMLSDLSVDSALEYKLTPNNVDRMVSFIPDIICTRVFIKFYDTGAISFHFNVGTAVEPLYVRHDVLTAAPPMTS